jgi:hypothetical protein
VALQITGQPQGVFSASQKSGTPSSVNMGWHNELLKSDLLPRYSYLTLAGKVFSVGNTAFAALTAPGTAVTGLTLFNPANSGVNALVLDIEAAFTPVTLATVAVTPVLSGVAQAYTPTGLTTLTPASALVGNSATPQCKTYSAATVAATGNILRIIGNVLLTVLTTSGGANASAVYIKDDVAGAIIVPPGNLVYLGGLGTVADATVAASMTWAELPI